MLQCIGMAYSVCFSDNILSQSCGQNFGQHTMVPGHEKLVVTKLTNKEIYLRSRRADI